MSEAQDDGSHKGALAMADDMHILPPHFYTDAQHHATEIHGIFEKEWLLVGRGEQLRDVGDYLSLTIAEEPVVVVRSESRQLVALSPVCRHRYMRMVAPGSGHVDGSFTCDYHLWRYRLDGRLSAAPFMDQTPGFDRSTCRLPVFAVEEWQGFVFVSLDGGSPPLAPRLAPVADKLRRYQLADMRQVAFSDEVWRCNWKVAVENGSESYHHMGVHPELVEPKIPTRGTSAGLRGDAFTSHRTPVAQEDTRQVSAARPDIGLTEEDLSEMNVFTIFPSTIILNFQDLVAWFSFLPIGVDGCRLLNGFCFSSRLVEAGLIDNDAMARFMCGVNKEDRAISELVQLGMKSTRAEPGMLSIKEVQLADFFEYVRGAVSTSGPGKVT
ncbi:aromatic ring-hydroxylating oxygenase subunit alpha [Actinophytocola sp.]|uniref:aromatic ring-hydroxylating oxygenase subunit alpha n=1 Tax=Actinophytocola sp. TaxID=1872138 RepID=UPI00389A738B